MKFSLSHRLTLSLLLVLSALSMTSSAHASGFNNCSQLASGSLNHFAELKLPFEIAPPSEASERELASDARPGMIARGKEALPQSTRLALTRGALKVIETTVVNYEGTQVFFKPETAHPFPDQYKIVFGEKIGIGMQGSVYALNQISKVSHAGLRETPINIVGSSIIKVPHRIKIRGQPAVAAEISVREEGATYKLLQNFEEHDLPQIEQSRDYPSQKYWTSKHIPTIPVTGGFTTEQGTFLIKPRVNGWNLKQIYQKFGSHLPPQMEESLKTLYGALKVLDKQWPTLIAEGTRQGTLTGQRQALDINPRNLIWLPQSEVAALTKAGVPIEKEGFFLVEFAFAGTSMPQINSWEAFKLEFEKALVQFH